MTINVVHSFYAVCNCNGPISILLEGDTVEEAVASFNALNGREAIDDARTDLEDELGIDGSDMSEEEFEVALVEQGATPVRSLEGDANVQDAWHLWSLVTDTY